MKFMLLLTILSILTALTLVGYVSAKVFTLDDFSFNIPTGCKSDKEKNRFQTTNIHLECGVSGGVHKEMVFESGLYDELVDMNATPESTISELESMQHLIYSEDSPETFESGSDKYTVNNSSAPYVISTWKHTGTNLFGAELSKDVVGMIIAVKLSDTKVVVAQYIASEDAFDKNLKKFESAVMSIKPTTGASQPSTDSSSWRQGVDTHELNSTQIEQLDKIHSELCASSDNYGISQELCKGMGEKH